LPIAAKGLDLPLDLALLGRRCEALGDAAYGEKAAHEMGVKRVSVPNRSTKSQERRNLQKTRWFKKGQKWRTGCEGRISWVGRGTICDNLVTMGHYLHENTGA